MPFEEKAPRITGSSDECGARDADEIVVCGYRRISQRLEALPPDYKERPLIAETSLVEGVTGKLSVESTEFIPGVKNNRVIITIAKSF